jgi:hypothetical protein
MAGRPESDGDELVDEIRNLERLWLKNSRDDLKRSSRVWARSLSAADHDFGGKVGLARFLGYRAFRPSRWARLITERRDVPSREAARGPMIG